MSGNMAVQMAEQEDIKVRMLLTREDIAPGAEAPVEDRRGLVGCLSVYKVAGAAAEAGRSLDEVYEIATRLNDNMATLAVALKPATHPRSGEEIFQLADDEMEIGMGQHGEAGTGRSQMLPADETAERMLNRLLPAVSAQAGDRLLVMLNGAGATTQMELFIVFRRVRQLIEEKGMSIAHSMVGEYLTVQEMAGFQMFVANLDDELIDMLKAPSNAPYWVTR
jgi:dihydroxyacetone kinase-like protein